MENVLSILCIVFLAILTYGLVQGSNLQHHHKHNCRTLYISENIDLETAYKSIEGKDTAGLKQRARQLGASREFVVPLSDIELKVFIIQTSISDDHILSIEIEDQIKARDAGRTLLRQIDLNESVELNPDQLPPDQLPERDSNLILEELYDDFSE